MRFALGADEARDTPQAVDEAIFVRLRAAWNPDRAAGEAAYLKSDRPFIGVDVPTTRAIVKAVVCTAPTPPRAVSVGAAERLWARPEFDARRAATEVLCAIARRSELDLDALPWLQSMVADGETWAIVDPLALGVVGMIGDLHRDKAEVEAFEATMRRWSTSESLWVRRVSMLALLTSLRRDLDRWPLFVELADSMMGEKEFFIRKAIGWVARDVGRRWPEEVIEWAQPRLEQMSGVTRREVIKHLPQLG